MYRTLKWPGVARGPAWSDEALKTAALPRIGDVPAVQPGNDGVDTIVAATSFTLGLVPLQLSSLGDPRR
jgi:hypothetical protein